MLVKDNRLTRKKDFDNIYQKGKSLSFENINLKYIANNLSQSRVGFIVSQKISKKAVDRNRLKRLLRESFRLALKENKLKAGFDIVIVPYPKILDNGIKELKLEEINKIILSLLKKANLLK